MASPIKPSSLRTAGGRQVTNFIDGLLQLLFRDAEFGAQRFDLWPSCILILDLLGFPF